MQRSIFCRLYNLSLVLKRHAGHSKWANIKHIKGIKDAEKNVNFTKLSRQIKVAVQEGGSLDPNSNIKLKQVIDQCKRFNMPQTTLQSVLKSCQSDKSNSRYHLIEIKGPGSSIILCELFTNNLHLIKQHMSTVLKKHQSKYSDGGAVHIFEEKGIILAENSKLSQTPKEELIEQATGHAIESNAEEVNYLEDNVLEFVCSKIHFMQTQDLLETMGYTILNASVDYIPFKTQDLGASDYEIYEKLIKKLEEFPEVLRTFDNVNVS